MFHWSHAQSSQGFIKYSSLLSYSSDWSDDELFVDSREHDGPIGGADSVLTTVFRRRTNVEGGGRFTAWVWEDFWTVVSLWGLRSDPFDSLASLSLFISWKNREMSLAISSSWSVSPNRHEPPEATDRGIATRRSIPIQKYFLYDGKTVSIGYELSLTITKCAHKLSALAIRRRATTCGIRTAEQGYISRQHAEIVAVSEPSPTQSGIWVSLKLKGQAAIRVAGEDQVIYVLDKDHPAHDMKFQQV